MGDIGLGEELLALGNSTTDLLDGLQGGVQVAGADEVANVEGVDLAVSLEVIDVKGEVGGINLLLLKSKLSHFVLGGLPLSSLTTIEGEDRTEVPMYKACKDSKDQGGFHDFVEILKLYDKNSDDTILEFELFKLLVNLGEKLTKEEAKNLM